MDRNREYNSLLQEKVPVIWGVPEHDGTDAHPENPKIL
jgi:hypothetical protein